MEKGRNTKDGFFNVRLELRVKNAKLISARESAGLTITEVAKRLGIPYPVYVSYESMRLFPNKERQKKNM